MISVCFLLWIALSDLLLGFTLGLLTADHVGKKREERKKRNEKEPVRCRDCKWGTPNPLMEGVFCSGKLLPEDWWCKDGERGMREDPEDVE
ncbi:MAG: hypothetical protein J5482_02810 [Oscillospiraceae bacterium]|nr:hypothetical protein [Oscillospiraceae bacterium]